MRRAASAWSMLLACAAPCAAQDLGSRISRGERARIPEDLTLSPQQKAQRTMNAYTVCLVARSRKLAERFVATERGSPEERDLAVRVSVPECLDSGELRFKPALVRGGIYEALYRKDFGRAAATDIARRSSAAEGADERDGEWGPLLSFARCVARTDAAGVRTLLLAPAATRREEAAIAKLQPALNDCLAAGGTVRFSRIVLRGLLAETTYKLSSAPLASADAAAGRPASAKAD